jgi:uncharacterized membrane protein YagU involved in acid resistance
MRRPIHLSELLCGTAAGVAATYPMTVLMESLDGFDIGRPQSELPPRIITDEVVHTFAHEQPPESVTSPATKIAHYTYGGLVGTLFPFVDRVGCESRLANGVAYGLGVWAASYCGLLPLLGSSARATNRPARVNAIMIAAHVVWGASLAQLTDRTDFEGTND